MTGKLGTGKRAEKGAALSAAGERIPTYIRIRDALRDAINQGIYKAGAQLPSETELARRFATTRATVVHALQALVFEHVIERKQGVGTFVATSAAASDIDTNRLGFFERDMQLRGERVTYQVFEFAEAAVSASVRKRLDLPEHEPVHKLVRLRLIAGQPFAVEERYLPSLTAAGMSMRDLGEVPIQDIFESGLGLMISRIANSVWADMPRPDVAKALGIARTRPVLVREHSIYGMKDTPLLWGKTYYREEYQVRYTTGAAHPSR